MDEKKPKKSLMDYIPADSSMEAQVMRKLLHRDLWRGLMLQEKL